MELETPGFVRFIIERLKQAGYQAYIVGGALRNALLHLPQTDWDVATSASSGEIKDVFSDTKFFAIKHNTITLINSERNFEVTPFRGEKNSLVDDLRKRDFTINAMAFDPGKRELIDPLGGKEDIKLKSIRAAGNPAMRFREDPLRLLRAVRLAVELGFTIEACTFQTLTDMSPAINSVSQERIREELMKILLVPKPSSGFNLMIKAGLLSHFLPEIMEGRLKRQGSYHAYTILKHTLKTLDRADPVPFLRLSALFHDIAKPRVRRKLKGDWRFYGHEQQSALLTGDIMERLKFSKKITRKVQNLVLNHMIEYTSTWSDAAVRRLIQRVGPENINELVMLRRADLLAHGTANESVELLDELESRIEEQLSGPMLLKTTELAIGGREVMDVLGVQPGPVVGKSLNFLREIIIDSPESNEPKKLMDILRDSANDLQSRPHQMKYSLSLDL